MSALPQFPTLPGEPYREPSIEEFTGDLARVNEYRAHEVIANRNGFMSTPQFFRLLWRASKPLRRAAWALLVWLALLTLVGGLFRSRLMRVLFFQSYAIEAVTVSLSVALSFLVAIFHTTGKTWLLIKDLFTEEVTSVEGRLDPTWQEEMGEGFKRVQREMVPIYHYSVRQENFEVQPEAYELLRSKYEDFRPVVRIYFTRRSRQLLSIEPLQADPARYRLDKNNSAL